MISTPLSGKRALITGAGSGIGKAAANCLARAGATIAALDLSRDDAENVVSNLPHTAREHYALGGDVGDEADMTRAVDDIARRWNGLDILVANAGINGVWAPLDKLEVDEWDTTIKTNLRGTFLTVRTALPLLRRAGGSIVIVASVNGTRVFSNTGATAYACSKAAQVVFAKMTALEFAKDKIRVNVICPGAIETNIEASTTHRNLDEVRVPVEFPDGDVPLTHGEPGTAEQVAQLILFLASDAASHITGTEIYIDGAQSLIQG